MGKTVAYLRASTDKQDLNHQKLEVLEYARKHAFHIDEYGVVSRNPRKFRHTNSRLVTLTENPAHFSQSLQKSLNRSAAKSV